MSGAVHNKQVTVRLSTKLDAKYRVPDIPLTVPANVTRLGLSKIINHLLQLEPAKPFDFLVDGELLRQSLEVALVDKAVSTESVVDVEYTFVTLPPELNASVPQKDWVAAVCALGASQIVAGGCDGVLNIYNGAGQLQTSCHAHEGGVTAVAGHVGEGLLVSAGKDGLACCWRLEQEQAVPLVRLEAHQDAVQEVALDATARSCATASWDTTIRIWDLEASALDDSTGAASKRQKVGKTRAACMNAPHATTECQSTLEGHSQVVSGLAWPSTSGDSQTLYSGSWDHTLRQWDVRQGTCVHSISTGKAIQGICTWASSSGTVAAGGLDGVLRLWDARGSSETLALKGLKSHAALISSVAWSPSSEFLLVSGSHDKTVRMWDVRCAIPLATLEQHQDKVLAVGWASEKCIISGGADALLHIYSTSSLEE